jgi:hypothetical protein
MGKNDSRFRKPHDVQRVILAVAYRLFDSPKSVEQPSRSSSLCSAQVQRVQRKYPAQGVRRLASCCSRKKCQQNSYVIRFDRRVA